MDIIEKRKNCTEIYLKIINADAFKSAYDDMLSIERLRKELRRKKSSALLPQGFRTVRAQNPAYWVFLQTSPEIAMRKISEANGNQLCWLEERLKFYLSALENDISRTSSRNYISDLKYSLNNLNHLGRYYLINS